MGQQDSRPQLRPAQQTKTTLSPSQSRKRTLIVGQKVSKRVHYDGLLRLQTTPFKNCIQIETQGQVLFLQNIDVTLKQLLQGRLNTNRLFMVEDVMRLIEEVSFTLAFLQEQHITYRDVSADNIYYDNGSFKLLPNELVQMSSYQKLLAERQVYPSPELIIALRSGQQEITDQQILQIANVFTLGMVFLQVATLLPSSQCYDANNYDILDDIIKQRLSLVQEYYGQIVSSVISRMVDYDYQRRHNIKDLSIWINRQFQSSRVIEQSETSNSKVEKKQNVQVSRQKDKSRMKTNKNNSVYMGSGKEDSRQQRNKIYINQGPNIEEIPSRPITRQPSKASFARQKNPYQFGARQLQRQPSRQDLSRYTEKVVNIDYSRGRQAYLQQNFQAQKAQLRKNNLYEKNFAQKDATPKRIVKEPTNPYKYEQNYRQTKHIDQPRYQSKGNALPLRQKSNQFYPKVQELLKSKTTVGVSEHKQSVQNDWDLRKLKQGIRKNKQLVQDLKRNQGLAS